MPWKLRFYLTKNNERKRSRRQHYLPLSATELKVSIPLTFLFISSINDVQQLQRRVDTLKVPSEWKEHEEIRGSGMLLFTSTCVYSDRNLVAGLAVKITNTLDWSLTCNGQEINTDFMFLNCKPPTKISNFRTLQMILQTITRCQVCSGNEAIDFLDVLSAEELTASNLTG